MDPAPPPPFEPPPVPEPPPPPANPDPAKRGANEVQLGIIMHLLPLALLLHGVIGFVVPVGLNVLAPLVFWLMKKNESSYLDAHGKEVVNFNISFSIYIMVCMVLFFVLSIIIIGFLFIPVMWVLGIAWLVLTVIGAIQASDGKLFRYPGTVRLIR